MRERGTREEEGKGRGEREGEEGRAGESSSHLPLPSRRNWSAEDGRNDQALDEVMVLKKKKMRQWKNKRITTRTKQEQEHE